MTTIASVLKKVHHRLLKPDAWIQGVNAKNIQGIRTGIGDSDTISWCLSGAVRAETCRNEFLLVVEHVQKLVPSGNIVAWNDTPFRTHNDVLGLLTQAISAAEAKGI